ncbi:bifunctional riboflavin kinase/FAD synthetase [Paenactinomyces guangxiensis]|uniref:Riboflavin biosynthesis protein n=1 Tax=Paenactinomyces guangxiensis TaxID=1490290 RepID=A0A7W1WQZ1_9BACL|nr:bifunctional riboflavin kinase/FAD synthetase [Paenactinomyces guangxiensis]MBA4494377.1 bifunctional riboflavin kinase/FAD synthetase [Paenactinomyces guangxiensis]MBH8591568.1 bifunctional riboflavin kinase/FAD synthetase [Paenactinomyces guangxiensis]
MQTKFLTYPFDQCEPEQHISLAIGYFDGVHRGHQAVIAEAKAVAKEMDAIPAVMTFYPHPREVLGHANITRYLTPLPEKLRQFAKSGVECTYVIKFDLTFAALSQEEFVHKVLVPLGVKGVTVGYNFTFGREASGKASDLERLGKGIYVARVVDPIEAGGIVVSSTRLRQALAQGEMEAAAQILGRNYLIEGKVVPGDRRGRLLGFPTANLALEQPFLTPRRGVYVVKVQYGENQATGIMNIGVRPTFSDPTPRERLEVHLFDREVDLYGQVLRVEFLHFIRDEKKFPSVDALIDQIRSDKKLAEEWLATSVE